MSGFKLLRLGCRGPQQVPAVSSNASQARTFCYDMLEPKRQLKQGGTRHSETKAARLHPRRAWSVRARLLARASPSGSVADLLAALGRCFLAVRGQDSVLGALGTRDGPRETETGVG